MLTTDEKIASNTTGTLHLVRHHYRGDHGAPDLHVEDAAGNFGTIYQAAEDGILETREGTRKLSQEDQETARQWAEQHGYKLREASS